MGIEWGAQILRARCVIIGPREYAEILNIKDITTENDGNSASMHNTIIKIFFLSLHI